MKKIILLDRESVPAPVDTAAASKLTLFVLPSWYRYISMPSQEQSQAPALGGRETQKSFEALKGLMEYAKARSTHQILLMTWGYLHGDGTNHPAIFPDYHAMQVESL